MAKLEMKKEKFSGLDGRTYTRWIQIHDEPRPFMITASPSGIHFKGTMTGEIETMEELQDFAKLLSTIQMEHIALRKDALSQISRPS